MSMKIILIIFVLSSFIGCVDNSTNQNKITADKKEESQTSEQEAIPLKNIDSADTPEVKTENQVTESIQTALPPLEEIKEEVVNSFHEYKEYNEFLKSHVSTNGKVNYAKIKVNESKLNLILESFKTNTPELSWTRNQKLAYWINSYNAHTLSYVTNKYPVKSILDINNKPWDQKFIPYDKDIISLNDIEHKKIRGQFNEARIHFALNCASKSCPKLLNKAYRPEILQSQLEKQTRLFLNDSGKNDLNDSTTILISSIFDWYNEDFSTNGKTVLSFIRKRNESVPENVSVDYMKYSWELND